MASQIAAVKKSGDVKSRLRPLVWKTGPQDNFAGLENWDAIAELDGTNSPTTYYLRGDVVDQVFARIDTDSGDPFYLLSDQLASIRFVTDVDGVVKDQLTYDGFGNITNETDSAQRGRYTWASREWDEYSQLFNNRERWYAPQFGVWMTRDPSGFNAGDSNLYRYVHNAPTNGVDTAYASSFVQNTVASADFFEKIRVQGCSVAFFGRLRGIRIYYLEKECRLGAQSPTAGKHAHTALRKS